MDILVQPPREVQPGTALNPPIVIVLRDLSGSGGNESSALNTTAYWGTASVVSEDGLTALAPPDIDLVSGNLFDSIQEVPGNGERVVGYLRFTNLALQRPGRYRIHISLIEKTLSSFTSRDSTNVMSVMTHVIHVHHSASAPVISEHLSDLISHVLTSRRT